MGRGSFLFLWDVEGSVVARAASAAAEGYGQEAELSFQCGSVLCI